MGSFAASTSNCWERRWSITPKWVFSTILLALSATPHIPPHPDPAPGRPVSSHLAGPFWFVFWQCWVLVAAPASLCDVQGLLLLWSTGSRACGLCCHKTFGILVPWPGIEPVSSALEGRFSTSGPLGKSPLARLNCQVFQVIRWPGFSGNAHTISPLCERKHFIEWPQSVRCDWDVAWVLCTFCSLFCK